MPETTTPATTTAPVTTPAAAPPAAPPAPSATALGTTTPEPSKATEPQTALGGPPPAALELKLPEGVTVEGDVLEKFKAVAVELGLDAPKAQKGLEVLLAARTAALETLEKQIHDEAKAQGEKWLAEAKADPEIGGAKWETTVATASKAVGRFGGEKLREALNRTGLGNNPAVIRAFYLAGAAISEDSLSGKGPKAPASNDPDALLRKLYPTMFQNKEE